MDAAPAALRLIATRWRAKSPPTTSSPLPDVSDSSRKMAMGAATSASVNVDEPPLRDLNNALRILVELFPNVQPEVFREMLFNTSAESRLQMVTENLLRDELRYVRGRLRAPGAAQHGQQPDRRGGDVFHDGTLKTDERFRSLSYKTAVTDALSQEFKGLSRSAIRALLAECNFSYLQSRERLLELSAKSWRFSVTRFLFRRRTPVADEHPLIVWESCRVGSASLLQPTLRFTPSTELNLELWNTLIQPVLNKQKQDQALSDRQYAIRINEDQAELLGETYECSCCFTARPMEQLSNCTDQCHYLCYTCIHHTVNEALFGQGWARSIDHDRCTVKCIAPGSAHDLRCEGFIPSSMVQRALEAEQKPNQDLWDRLRDKCADEALLKSRLPLVRCPFCTYAELDDFDAGKVRWRWRPIPVTFSATLVGLFLLLSTFSYLRYILQPLIAGSLLYLATTTWVNGRSPIAVWLERSLLRVTRKRRGLRFKCRSPRCSRFSCLNCRKAWCDIHICYESSKLALRAAIEAATTGVVKRTCPVCSLSFVKAAGCNKLACVCGYTMCYICRQEIGKESYTHFCQHFRQRPGEPCQECNRCDLYKVEDEDDMVREAALRAEKEWWEQEEATGTGSTSDTDQSAKKDQLSALEEETMPLTSTGRVHAFLRVMTSRARWERLSDKIISELVE